LLTRHNERADGGRQLGGACIAAQQDEIVGHDIGSSHDLERLGAVRKLLDENDQDRCACP
jgi:hypothetical protein